MASRLDPARCIARGRRRSTAGRALSASASGSRSPARLARRRPSPPAQHRSPPAQSPRSGQPIGKGALQGLAESGGYRKPSCPASARGGAAASAAGRRPVAAAQLGHWLPGAGSAGEFQLAAAPDGRVSRSTPSTRRTAPAAARLRRNGAPAFTADGGASRVGGEPGQADALMPPCSPGRPSHGPEPLQSRVHACPARNAKHRCRPCRRGPNRPTNRLTRWRTQVTSACV